MAGQLLQVNLGGGGPVQTSTLVLRKLLLQGNLGRTSCVLVQMTT